MARELALLATPPGPDAPPLAAGLALAGCRELPGGVEFRTDAAGLAALQLRVRTASRVVVRLATFRATAFHELERAARQVEWGRMLPEGAPFRLRVTCRKSRLYHSDAVAERVAAAIARAVKGATFVGGKGERDEDEESETLDPQRDAQRESQRDPPQLFLVRLDRDRCTISADASGALLHRRGYRQAVARAPLRETLAAALLFASEWDLQRPLVDPMCGSGTIPIEAALMARRIAPGLGRAFAAERWPETPAGAWPAARDAARAEQRPIGDVRIVGADRDAGAVAAARANAERAGVAADVDFRCVPLSSLEPPAGPGWVVTNPPYGVRVGDTAALRSLYAAFGQLFDRGWRGWRATIIAADGRLLGQTARPWRTVVRTTNGGLTIAMVTAGGTGR